MFRRAFSQLFSQSVKKHTLQRRLRKRSRTVTLETLEDRTLLTQLGPRWTSTATDGGGLGQGDATTLTWSIVPDGTGIPGFAGEDAAESNLVEFLEGIYGSNTDDDDYTDEPWFPVLSSIYDRWSELSGLDMVYEPNDDGVDFSSNANANPGVLGVRGDARVGGHLIDGNSGILAYNFFPNNGEMVVDTGDNFYNNTGGNSIRMRNVLAHELGHGIGIAHVESNDGSFLMEPFINTSFDGPQYDDILGTQRHYGDFYEQSNNKAGNETTGNATPLGTVPTDGAVAIGTNGDIARVEPDESDFVSIDDDNDIDVYSFTTTDRALITLELTPVGPTYNQGPQGGSQSPFDASAQSDLTLELIDSNGNTVLATSNSGGLGASESIVEFELLEPDTYFARITGAQDTIQTYRLDITNTGIPLPSLSIDDVTVNEGDGTATFTVSLSEESTNDVMFDYATADDLAVAGEDYTSESGTGTIPAGSMETTITVSITDDALDEVTETYFVELSEPVEATISDGVGVGSIEDNNDPEPELSITDITVNEAAGVAELTVSSSFVSGRPIQVDFETVDGTATAGADYTATDGTKTIAAGTTETTIVVSIANDELDENSESFTVVLSNPAGASITDDTGEITITDNDETPLLDIGDVVVDEGAGTASFVVELTAPSGLTVDFNYETVDGSAVAGDDYGFASGTGTIAAGDSFTTVTVNIIDDGIIEPTEDFFVVLDSPVNAGIADGEAVGTIEDNDFSVVSIAAGDDGNEEGPVSGFFTVSQTIQTSVDTVISYTVGGSATNGADYDEISGSVTIPAGETSVELVIATIDDAVDEGDETVEILLTEITSESGSVELDEDNSAAEIDIFDNDSTPEADLSLTKSVDSTSVLVGEQVTFTIIVTNSGPDAATGIEILDALPAGLSYVSSTTSAGGYDSGTGVWEIEELADSESATLTVTAEVTDDGELVNVAEVMAVDQADPDSTPGNGVVDEDDYAAVTIQGPGVGLNDGILRIVGTDLRDIVLLFSRRNAIRLIARLGRSRPIIEEYPIAEVNRIIVLLRGGNDTLYMSNRLEVDTIAQGGDGNDRLTTGGGNDVAVGGDGRDRLNTQNGQDIAIGGEGSDAVFTGNGEDIVIAGYSVHDDDLEALDDLYDEWNTSADYLDRVDTLRNGTGTTGISLAAGMDVFDDGVRDSMNGGRDRDWFFGNREGNRRYQDSARVWFDEEFDQLPPL